MNVKMRPQDFIMFKKVDDWFNKNLDMFNLDKVYGINIISELYGLIKDIEMSKKSKEFLDHDDLVTKQESHDWREE